MPLSSILCCAVLVAALIVIALRLAFVTKRARAAMQELERIIALAPAMLCVADFAGRFIRVNPAWERILGFTSDELTARPFLDFVHPDDQEGTIAEMAKLEAGERTVAFENRYECKDGSWRWLLWSATPVAEERRIYAAARDITERKSAERGHLLAQEAAEAANRELEAFSYSVSHDLRAPLRSVDGFSQALLEDCGETLGATGKDHLRRVRAATQRMGELIDDLLALSRLSREELRREPVDLSALARLVADELCRREPQRVVDFAIADGATAEGDPRFLRVALENLLGNAWKFTRTRAAARIEFGVARDSGGAAFFVRDNGVGFDMAHARRLFGAFQRLHSSAQFEGTGVGLATVQRVVRRHGGRVSAEAAVDRGATFTFTLGQKIGPKIGPKIGENDDGRGIGAAGRGQPGRRRADDARVPEAQPR